MLKNEKGLTFIEVLTALSISSIVIVVMFSLYSSINQHWNNSVQSYNDQSAVDLAVDVISRELASPTHLYFYSTSGKKELRYETFEKQGSYRAIVYDIAQQSLSLYEINSLTAVTPAYTNETILTDKITEFDVYLMNPSGSLIEPPLSYTTPTEFRQLFQIRASRPFTRVRADGSEELYEKEMKINVVPF